MDEDLMKAAMADAKAEQEKKGANLEKIAGLVNEQIRLEDELESLKEKQKEVQAALDEIRDQKLPDMMLENNVKNWTTTDGRKVSISQIYFPSVPKAKMKDFADWLMNNGEDGIVKPTVAVVFQKGDWEDAEETAERLKTVTNRPVEVSADIHWATFRAFARELAENGDLTPPDYYKAHSIHRASIKRK